MELKTKVVAGMSWLVVDGKAVPYAPPGLVKEIARQRSGLLLAGEVAEAPPLHLSPVTVEPGQTVMVGGGFPAPKEKRSYRVQIRVMRADGTPVADFPFTTLLTVGEPTENFDMKTIQAAYRRAFKDCSLIDKYKNWAFTDPQYKKAVKSQVIEVIKAAKVYTLPYHDIWQDCDDFAQALAGALEAREAKWQPTSDQALFITYVVFKHEGQTFGHALLSMFDGKQVLLVEPQVEPEKAVYPVPADWQLFLITG